MSALPLLPLKDQILHVNRAKEWAETARTLAAGELEGFLESIVSSIPEPELNALGFHFVFGIAHRDDASVGMVQFPPLLLGATAIKPFNVPFNRRRLLKSMAVAFAGWSSPGIGTVFTKFPSVRRGPIRGRRKSFPSPPFFA